MRSAKVISCLLAGLAGMAIFGMNLAAARETSPEIPPRLSRSVVPVAYELFFEPDITAGTFRGKESIALSVANRVEKIVLHCVGLKVNSAELRPAKDTSSKESATAPIDMTAEDSQLVLSSPKPIDPGSYNLSLTFSGKLNEKLCGFYRATMRDNAGHQTVIATTQMEPTDARRMFPCFDEPSFKASFKISVVVDGGNTAISNSPIAGESVDARTGKRTITFGETPKMSTYLVALTVGPFRPTSPVVASGVPIRVWALQGQEKLGAYARSVAARLIPFMVNYFGQPYPSKKLDLIAIPDFEAGAMENLGAITFRDIYLLADEEKCSVETKQAIAGTVAHEMAHMWFGDLVTMEWWDDLWLNEAFATWMSVKAVDYLKPDWHAWTNFTHSKLSAMDLDVLKASRPIHASVKNPSQAMEMFDGITYSKGASVLRMLETFVGEKTFQQGVQNYMREHCFANATTNDLWQAIGDASGKPVRDIMHQWVYKAGYPVIAVNAGDAGKLELSQAQFSGDMQAAAGEKWQVPVFYRSALVNGKGASSILLSERRALIDEISSDSKPIINAHAQGYYRVNYSPELLTSLLKNGLQQLDVGERLSLLSDRWALTFFGYTPVDDYLKLTELISAEREPEVIAELVKELEYLNAFVEENQRKDFQRLVQSRLAAIAFDLGWKTSPQDSDLRKIARSEVLAALGTIGQDAQTIEEARKLFADYVKDERSVDPDLLDAITSIVAYNGDKDTYSQIERLWRASRTPEVRERNLMALSRFRQPELIERTLKLTLSSEVKLQDSPNLLASVLATESGRSQAWKFIKANWKALKNTYPMPSIPHVVARASLMSTQDELDDLTQFLEDHPIEAGARKVAQTLEHVKNRVNFRRRSGPALSVELSKVVSANR